ncbi:MAG: hypothetical protein LIP06_03950 [Tannerellaceae bacterium]|nr:hypothetical protein [Tannerellaceae bacterium]
MKKDIINLHFHSVLNSKVPNKTKLANLLVDILQIEKEAIYRRLRSEVPFTFAEVARISERLSISLDQLIGIQSEKVKPFSLQLTDFEHPGEIDYVMWENYVNLLSLLSTDPSLVLSETWNTVPFTFCYRYTHLTRFNIFKWTFQAKNHTPIKRFSQIQTPPRLKWIGEESFKKHTYIPHTQFIFDERIFANFIRDVHIFANTRLIEKEDISLIKSELEELINYMEETATRGTYKDTENEVSFYISGISIDTNHCCIEANGYHISLIRILLLNAAATTDESTFLHIKQWFTSLKRISTLISVSGEKHRVSFFNQQRELLQSL